MGTMGEIAVGRREYGLRTSQKVLYLIAAAATGAMSVFILVLSAKDVHPAPQMVISAVFAVAGIYLATTALRSRLIFDGTQVRVEGAIRMRQFDVSQVEGYRTYQSRYGSYRVICLKDGARPIQLMKYATDPKLDNWFDGLKNLDDQDRRQLLEKIDEDQELGATPEERQNALRRGKQINVALWLIDAASAALFLWGPEQYRFAAMAVLALSPLAAAYLLYRQPLLYGFIKPKRDPRADVILAVMISGFGLMFGAARATFVSIGLLLPFIIFGWLLSMAMYYPATRKNPRFASALFTLCFVSAIYGWGLAAAADIEADHTTPQIYTAQVLGGHVSHGSRSTSYYLELEPWGPYEAVNNQMKVSAKMYYATRQGDVVCLALHTGALHVPWYEPVVCGNQTP